MRHEDGRTGRTPPCRAPSIRIHHPENPPSRESAIPRIHHGLPPADCRRARRGRSCLWPSVFNCSCESRDISTGTGRGWPLSSGQLTPLILRGLSLATCFRGTGHRHHSPRVPGPRDRVWRTELVRSAARFRGLLSSKPDAPRSRTHLGLEKDSPEPRPIESADTGHVITVPEVGGLHHSDALVKRRKMPGQPTTWGE